MNLPDKHPSNVSFDELTGHSYQDDEPDPQWHYQGRSVETLRSSCPPYFSQSAADQNDAHSVCPLTGFHITSLTQSASNVFDVSDIPNIPESSIYRYFPENYAESIDHELSVISSSYHCDQPCLSAIEPGIRKPTLANRLNSDHHSTHLPAELANPQDSRPVAVASPLNLQQSTGYNPVISTKIHADQSSQAEHRRKRQREYQRKLRKNPAYRMRERKRHREHYRERYRTDPTYAERRRLQSRLRYQNDPVFAERRRLANRRRYRDDSSYAERRKKLARERRQQDPVYAKGQNIYIRVYDRMKKIVAKEEASKLAAKARKEYLQSVNCPETSGDLPQASTSAETRQNANENSDAPPLGNEPDTREPASANRLNPDYHLTNLPAELANPQDSRPVAVASLVEASENLSSISESSDSAQASGAAGKFFTYPAKQMPITIMDSKIRCQDETSEVSEKSEKAGSGSELEIKISRVWSMAVEEGFHFVKNSYQHSNIQTSLIVQADNLGNEFVQSCSTQKNPMIRHQQNHKNEKPYKCKECNKMYSQRSGLLFHQRRHAGINPYECKQCPKRFVQRCNLVAHERIHTGEKPFKCGQCNKSFTQKGHLTTHRRTHRRERPLSASNAIEALSKKAI